LGGRFFPHSRLSPVPATGVNEAPRASVEFLCGSEKSLIRLGMLDFMAKHPVSKLIGSPPSYVGYYEGGQWTPKARSLPVIPLDEIEKAAPAKSTTILLQVTPKDRPKDKKA
jgi:ATP-dependent Clp protease ATP-binding subunit ClpA